MLRLLIFNHYLCNLPLTSGSRTIWISPLEGSLQAEEASVQATCEDEVDGWNRVPLLLSRLVCGFANDNLQESLEAFCVLFRCSMCKVVLQQSNDIKFGVLPSFSIHTLLLRSPTDITPARKTP